MDKKAPGARRLKGWISDLHTSKETTVMNMLIMHWYAYVYKAVYTSVITTCQHEFGRWKYTADYHEKKISDDPLRFYPSYEVVSGP